MLKTVSLAAALLLASQSALVAQPSIEWLEPFVGVWATVDTYYPVSGEPTVERATRTCARIMQDTYLQCETIAQRPSGASRTYRFLLNYNRTVARFEMLSLWSNVPHKLAQSMVPNGDRRRWTFANVAVIGDDEPMADHWSELVFESSTRIVWTGRRIGPGVPPAAAPISFQETWTRVN